jgi:DNA-directed RNA polymerase subunit beta
MERSSFSSVKKNVEYPDFLSIQLESFKKLFQLNTTPLNRKNEVLYKGFTEIFPITDVKNNYVLEFLDYSIDPPIFSIKECIERGMTYSVSLKAQLKLYRTDIEKYFETICQEVYVGTFPYMTPTGSFIFNGSERIIVSQLHRSPGIFFGKSYHSNGKQLYTARVIPLKGSWIEFSTDINNVLSAYIDRKKKLPITTLLRSFGYEKDQDILELFHLAENIQIPNTNIHKILNRVLASRLLKTWYESFVYEDTGEVFYVERNEIILDRNIIIEQEHIDKILEMGVSSVLLYRVDRKDYSIIYNTLQRDKTNSKKEALKYIYKQLKNSEPPDEETAISVIEKLFFSRYSLGSVGRDRLNRRLKVNIDLNCHILTKEDIIAIIHYLNDLFNSKREIDDVDHLSNRRVRTVGEQLDHLFRIVLTRITRGIREKMNILDKEGFTPVDLINPKIFSSTINTFFGTNPLSQLMDQTNILSEMTHKRRLSSLGPGGLSRERAGFEVRDVNYSHYARLCPIESPEGPNIGLIYSLSTFAKVNEMGFIETLYWRVIDGKVNFLEKPVSLGAEEEYGKVIAQVKTPINSFGRITSDIVYSRKNGYFIKVKPEEVNYMDVASNQIASISASLIPFIEHNDANRALMGSNMMRQAVPLLKPKAPIVGTGIEKDVVKDSRMFIRAEKDGIIEYVDANQIHIRYERSEEEKFGLFDPEVKRYNLIKFRKTNQNTCITIKPLVKRGMKVKKGEILCHGYSTDKKELALGRNLKVAFMPLKGYNFEDAIVISEKVVREDWFTSIHIEEYSLELRDTRSGMEEFTSSLPNVNIKNLDENGIIRIGSEVKPGYILVGKITPKIESDSSPEEKLLRTIFGEKSVSVKDTSLRADPFLEGVVIDTKLFYSKNPDNKSIDWEKKEVKNIEIKYKNSFSKLREKLIQKLLVLVNNEISQGVYDFFEREILPKGKKFYQDLLNSIQEYSSLKGNWTYDEKKNSLIEEILHNYRIKMIDLQKNLKKEKISIILGDELPSGIRKVAKISIAKKRKLKVGDKMSGRHGNKGVVAYIVRDEDMPFLEDGSRVDMVLNPLGVPSRMNIGQIYETILGWAGDKLGIKFSSPIFDGPDLEKINKCTDQAVIPRLGKVYLFDGETGERFDQTITVGVIYMLKLGHMVDDKMHARSIGPYSLITQQPLGGKAQFGGQRFGEMEVWALEAFGASNILQEMLTVKSDDIPGRAKTYESIVKGEEIPDPGVPESFKVVCNELKGLGFNVSYD